ncbi:MAG: hypothetical protein A3A33_04265 [Candidatus Yanofskybacteria bacterium RIFCSPLOWO2_01_FULL_49_25]|uniref:Uncharacterized protein n=1 Tax=Candidatus Yanofskybacteria bacterium RIFCSPLOWO2_01_FULL_49_25 TaxID=1802701 RepID=A0A1F8GR98_9BACT|nr:MAG: hypothetical protein A3A33_04265 [Candidatus Yanofskybacteria bacterium RIFCSPLOWO2_01_FULL_49_25]
MEIIPEISEHVLHLAVDAQQLLSWSSKEPSSGKEKMWITNAMPCQFLFLVFSQTNPTLTNSNP